MKPASAIIRTLLSAFLLAPAAYADDGDWGYGLYADVGYGLSNREPSDNVWRSKGTTNILNEPRMNLLMGGVGKVSTADSRWGMKFGLQFGQDADNQVPAPEKNPVPNADVLKHLYRAYVSYRLGKEAKYEQIVGIFESHIGYESYLAIENPNYTRAYILDYVPYFMAGLESSWDYSDTTHLYAYLITGYDYLSDINNHPSFGIRGDWKLRENFTFSQNFYYGPDQENTDREYWRFFSDTIVEWKTDKWLLAAALDFGNEEQADVAGNPRYGWTAAAIWLRYAINEKHSLALRPEVYDDPDGLQTGARQTIRAITGTYKYNFKVRNSFLVGAIELRYDKSTGDEGGFFDEPDDRLVPDQTILLFSLNWAFQD
jgi:hypothetical protein